MFEVTESSVKEMIDAQSGRFEFFKQALTLASAGVAGLAVVFTDPTRIPSSMATRIIAALVGLGFVSVIIFAFSGISTYANLLSLTAATDIVDRDRVLRHYKSGIVSHAKFTIMSFVITACLLFLYACFRIVSEPGITLSDAVTKSEAAISVPTLALGAVEFTRGQTVNDNYSIVFRRLFDDSQYVIEIDRSTGRVISITHK